MAAAGLTSVVFTSQLLNFIIYSVIISVTHGHTTEFVTCGSILKLINKDLPLRLHSHDIKYGTGSGQQSVTAIEIQEDVNSHWQVMPETGKHCKRGEPIKCGSILRLQHVATRKNLHSHHFTSPLSKMQEISCYGDEKGLGDTGDHWQIVCNHDFWKRDSFIHLRHVDTDVYLAASGRNFGRPIDGQGEVVGVTSLFSAFTEWKAKEGLFIHPDNLGANRAAHHTEL